MEETRNPGGRPPKHGHTGWKGRKESPEYVVWCKMRQRCLNPNATGFDRYGGAGVTICKRWDDFQSFLADIGQRPSLRHSLDRINPRGNYEPENCRWATTAEQALNRRDSVRVVIAGREVSLREAAALTGIKYQTLYWRLAQGKSIL
jgi:hypothetical protein